VGRESRGRATAPHAAVVSRIDAVLKNVLINKTYGTRSCIATANQSRITLA